MHMKKASNRAILAFALCHLVACSYVLGLNNIGINYGQLGNNLPSPNQAIKHIQSMNATYVKLYDTNSEVLRVLSGTKLRVAVMVANGLISRIAANQSEADLWLTENVLAYYPKTRIKFVLVGNEVFSSNDLGMWVDLVPAMINMKRALAKNGIHNIKVGTPAAMNMLESTFPPSSGRFRSDIPSRVIQPLLKFLNGSNSLFFLDVYPYFSWVSDPDNTDVDFALLKDDGNVTYKDPKSGLIYTNLLDQMLDSVAFAMAKLGFDNIRIAISETGWPHAGDIDQPGANAHNAAIYNRNLVAKMTSYPTLGTPARPGVEILTFIFSLYDENQKPGPGTERHWGVMDAEGNPIYELDLTGNRVYNHLPEPESNEPYKGKIWCVAASNATDAELGPALGSACRGVNGACDELGPGRSCYEPVSVAAHASYAFSSYWSLFRSDGASCYFDGLAVQTTIDPSHGSCEFPSVTV